MNKKSIAILSLMVGSLAFGAYGTQPAAAAVSTNTVQDASAMKLATVEDFKDDSRVFKIDPSIEVKKVRFQNHYGFQVVGDLYLPKDFNVNKTYKAIVVSGPFGAVKEQSSGLYAQEMAKNGFVALAFDPSMTGESSGTRRNVGSPEIFTEDFHAAVDFISNLSFVDRDRIGAIGICGLSGMAITATGSDARIKAVATSAMYDMTESMSDHYKGAYYTPEQRQAVQQYLADMRDQEAKSGQAITGLHEVPVDNQGKAVYANALFPEKLSADADSVTKEFFDYYRGRAYHPRSINSTTAWDATTPYAFFDFNLMDNIKELGNKPVLLITGDKAHSKYFSDDVFSKLETPNKKEIIVPGATHTDLYDNMNKIPFEALVSFFNQNLK